MRHDLHKQFALHKVKFDGTADELSMLTRREYIQRSEQTMAGLISAPLDQTTPVESVIDIDLETRCQVKDFFETVVATDGVEEFVVQLFADQQEGLLVCLNKSKDNIRHDDEQVVE